LIYEGSRTIRGGRNLILNPKFIPEGLSVTSRRFETHPFRGTDTRPFALKGIPTLAVTTGVKSPYHKPEDEAHLIDFNGMVLITEHLKNLIEFVANDTAYKASGRIAKWHRPQPRFILGFTANAGTNRHHYTAGAVTGKTTFSYGAGLFSQVNFGAMAIRPEVRYDRIRAKHPDGIISTDNLTIPLSLVVQHLRQGSGVGFFVGGYYTYRFDGTYRAEIMDFEKTFNREEKGLTFGFNIYARPIVIGFTRRVALTNFMQFPNADNAHLRNRTNYFTIGYFF